MIPSPDCAEETSVRIVFLAIFLLVLVAPVTVSATILGGSVTGGSAQGLGGMFIELNGNATFSVGNNNFNDNNLYAFNEGQNIVIGSPLSVQDLAGPAGAGVLAAGTVVASHYVIFDPLNAQSIQGNVQFDSAILALIWETADLLASDVLINNNVTYLNPSFRGLELAPHPNNDMAWISASNEVSVSLVASSPGDVLRVLTAFSPGAEIPEPSTVLLAGLGLAGMGLRRWRLNREAD